MARAKVVRDREQLFYGIHIKCPGCGHHLLLVSWLPEGEAQESPHAQGKPHWSFNGDFDRPTFQPSILSRGGTDVCHSFVADGRIQFLSDCTHVLAGHTVDLPEMES